MCDNIDNSHSSSPSSKLIDFLPVPQISITDLTQDYFEINRRPVKITGADIGPCREKWTPEFLESTPESCEKKVKVHRSSTPALDFRNKNFKYDTISFGQLIRECSQPNSGEYLYLRSLGEDPRGKDVSNISLHFPNLSQDINIPDIFPKDSFFSSVFRITSPKLQLWTHYDVCDNILIQVRGSKRVVFFPPSEALNLYLDGDKSAVLDIDNPDISIYPKFTHILRYETILKEGEIVFIPALWFHNITALDFSISLNVFWKNLEEKFYDKKDTYGNRDLVPAQLGLKTLEKATSQLKVLPKDYEDFYLRRMIIELEKRLANINTSSD